MTSRGETQLLVRDNSSPMSAVSSTTATAYADGISGELLRHQQSNRTSYVKSRCPPAILVDAFLLAHKISVVDRSG
jgi:hypothetical protein